MTNSSNDSSTERRPARGPRLPSAGDSSSEAAAKRRAALEQAGLRTEQLAGTGEEIAPEQLAASLEGFLGFARVPVGVFGPLSIRGEFAQGDFFVPLATTEGALIGSYQYVASIVNRAGGIVARCTAAAVWRAPVFVFESLVDARAFAEWLPTQREMLAQVVIEGSRHGRLIDIQINVVGAEAYVRLGFETGDAAGQNMVTRATQNLCARILEAMPTAPRHWLIESNLSGDKKATWMALQGARGKRASAELRLSAKLLRRYFRTDAAAMAEAWNLAAAGAAQSGTVGAQGNYANALAALFIATGQDVACVAEAAAGLTRVRPTEDGGLYFSVTLPNLIVGSVGGGTYLPTARESLEMLGCYGDGGARKLAEICAAVVLTGELALNGALAGGSFAAAHGELVNKSARAQS